MSNRGRHKKKKDNKIHSKIKIYDSNLNCYITFYIENNKLKIDNVEPRQTQKTISTFNCPNTWTKNCKQNDGMSKRTRKYTKFKCFSH